MVMIHIRLLGLIVKSLKKLDLKKQAFKKIRRCLKRSQDFPTKLNVDQIGGPVSDPIKAWVYYLFYQVCVQDGILRDEEIQECNRLYLECFGEDVTKIKSDKSIPATMETTNSSENLLSPSKIVDEVIIPKVGQFRIEVMARAFNEVYSSYQRKFLMGLCFRLVMVDGQGDRQEHRFIKQVGYRLLLTPEDFFYAFDSALRTR